MASCNISLVPNGSSRPIGTLKGRGERKLFNPAEADCIFTRSETENMNSYFGSKRLTEALTKQHDVTPLAEGKPHTGSIVLTSRNLCISL